MKRRRVEKILNPTGRRPLRAALRVLTGDAAARHGADTAAQISELESALEMARTAIESAHTAEARLREAIDILPQGIVFLDPDGRYVRRFVPELRDVPDRFVQRPWEAPRPPAGYPPPLVDHAQRRLLALERFRAARAGARP